ncbi:MAG TPA: hypothetical protein VD815_03580 [Candidatus Saccharimonadales bacterium]|nr:hypothetical protein [Candidatus Saccharimonadales bacterium]
MTTSVLIITLGILGIYYSYSQPIPSTTSENQISQQVNDSSLINTPEFPYEQSINWNQSLVLDPANVFCNGDGVCGGLVEVAFESNNTLVLESFNRYRIFDVAYMAKNLSGFQIDDVSTTPKEDGSIKYLVVMSK